MFIAASNPSNTTTPPSAPQNLTAIANTTVAQMDLAWDAPANNGGSTITGYIIYRDTSSSPTTQLTTVGNVLTYADTSTARSTTYYYRIKAENSVGTSDYSNEASDTTTVICTELYRQGLLSHDIYMADAEFGRRVHPFTKTGYLLWATPVVRMMRRSKLVTRIAYNIAEPWTRTMANQVGTKTQYSLVGSVLMFLGVPICYSLGVLLAVYRCCKNYSTKMHSAHKV